MQNFLKEELKKTKEQELYRSLKRINEKKYLNFCSNDYLGLSKHPLVIERTIEVLKKYGVGAGASRLVSGNTSIHEELEKKIAKLKKREAAIVFPTGYMANVGTISALLNENDCVIIDRLNHASIIDACKLSKAKLQVYPHKDMQALEKILQRSNQYAKRLIVTDFIFSMDGDIAPVAEIVKLAKKYNAWVMTDEAHATGVLENKEPVDIVMGTLSKAIGSLGGFIAGSFELIDFLRNKTRSFIYTTALPPAICAASIAAIEIIETQPKLLNNLRMNSRLLRENICRINSTDIKNGTEILISGSDLSPIIPIIVGDAKKTVKISEILLEKGIFVTAIRPPTVPKNESRLRITVTAAHTKAEIDYLVKTLKEML